MSEPGAGLYFSHARRFSAQVQGMQTLSLITALAVAQALEELGAADLQLKWPNDVLSGRRKLSGILLERKDGSNGLWIVFGIGINLCLSEAQRQGIDRPVCDLTELLGQSPDVSLLAAKLVNCLTASIDVFLDSGFRPFQPLWNKRDRYRGEDVVIEQGQQRLIGKLIEINTEGELRLLTANGEVIVASGEVFPSLRPLT